MTRAVSIFVVLITVFHCFPKATAQEASPDPLQISPIPAQPRLDSTEWMSLAHWYRLHADHVEKAHSEDIDVLFLGDSITASWQWNDANKAIFNRYFGNLTSANFAIGGDRSENLLWRLQHGLKGQLAPKVAVLLIGTNNIGHTQQDAATIYRGIEAVVAQVHENYPQAKIIVNGILPFKSDADPSSRQRVTEVNNYLKTLARIDYVTYVDFGSYFVDAEGAIPTNIMADGLHLTAEGLDVYARQLAPKIDYELNQFGRQSTWVAATDPRIRVMGRFAPHGQGQILTGFPGVSVDLRFNAKKVSVLAQASGEVYFDVILDGQYFHTVKIPDTPQKIALYEASGAAPHEIRLIKRTETWQGIAALMGFEIRQGELLQAPALSERKLLVLGDSVTCGEAVERVTQITPGESCDKTPLWWNPSASYGMQLAQNLEAQVQLVCYGGRGLIRDWEGRSEVATIPEIYSMAVAREPEPIAWEQENYQADLIISMIGTNDFSPAGGEPPSLKNYSERYSDFVTQLLKDHPQAHIVLTDGPILNNDDEHTHHKSLLLEYLYRTQKLAKSPRVHVIPTRPYPGDDCDGHPPRAAHQVLAEDFEPLIRNILGW